MNDTLGRNGSPFSEELWQHIDEAVIDTARQTLAARRFLPMYGPLGLGAGIAAIDQLCREEVDEDGFAVVQGRRLVQIPQLYEDFWLYWRDIEAGGAAGAEMNLSAAHMAAQALALREDKMVFHGVKSLGVEGLLTAKGVGRQSRAGSWSEGENAYADVARAMTSLLQKGRIGKLRLVVSPDVRIQMERLQPGTGLLESKRVEKLLGSKIVMSVSLAPNTAMLLSAQPQYMDLLVGQDISVAYLEAVDLNHRLRALETAIVRVKAPDAIVVFE